MPTTPPSEPASPAHRPALDGIRTIAVYLVVAFHAGSAFAGGGFIGVDVFFVLSGYLVTEVLLRDLDGPTGRVAFGRFYSRRVRRLLPAAVVTIVATAAVYGAVASSTALIAEADSMRAALLYVANWHFIGEATDYFAPDEQSPVLHFWSLAVEEQFYVVWPLLLTGVWLLVGRHPRTREHRRPAVAAVVAAMAATSFVAAMALRSSAPTRAYFGTDTRAYQLLAGACLALLPQLLDVVRRWRPSRLLAPLGVAGIAVVASGAIDQGPFVRSTGATIATVALILGVEAHDGSVLARALSLRPVAYLGTISYATYLWHWPIIAVIAQIDVLDLSATALAALTAVGATSLAALSSELLELPIRRSTRLDRNRLPVIVGGVAACLVAALVALPPLLDPDRPSAVDDLPDIGVGLSTLTPVPESFDFAEIYAEEFGARTECLDRPVTDCTAVEGDGPHLMLVGDSQAVMYIPALTELARSTGLRLSVAAVEGCPWQIGYTHLAEEVQERCRERRPDTYDRLIPELDPDVILLVNAQFMAGLGPAPAGDDARRLEAATDESLERLAATGAEIVIVDPAPRIRGFNPLACLDDATYVEECSFEDVDVRSWIDDDLRSAADRSESVHYVDWDTLICPQLPICEAVIGDTPVFWDGAHITARYSRALAQPIGDSLADLGVVPVGPDRPGG